VVRPSSLSPPLIVNYDAFKLDEDVANAYAEMVRSLEGSFYTRVSRYTTSGNAADRLMAVIASQRSAGKSCTRAVCWMPALLAVIKQ
jgi:hypothetical protein